jgi:hypothetical protein
MNVGTISAARRRMKANTDGYRFIHSKAALLISSFPRTRESIFFLATHLDPRFRGDDTFAVAPAEAGAQFAIRIVVAP